MSAFELIILLIGIIVWGLLGFIKVHEDSSTGVEYDTNIQVAWAIFIGGPFIWMVALVVVLDHVWIKFRSSRK